MRYWGIGAAKVEFYLQEMLILDYPCLRGTLYGSMDRPFKVIVQNNIGIRKPKGGPLYSQKSR